MNSVVSFYDLQQVAVGHHCCEWFFRSLHMTSVKSNHWHRGFKELIPNFAIRDAGSDQHRLPTASTCVNLLKVVQLRISKLSQVTDVASCSFLDTLMRRCSEKSYSRLSTPTPALISPKSLCTIQLYLSFALSSSRIPLFSHFDHRNHRSSLRY